MEQYILDFRKCSSKMAEGGPPDLETQKTEIGNLLKTQLKKGDTWYLLDIRWFKQWKKYVGYDSWDTLSAGDEAVNPGPIDNSVLFKEGSSNQLKEHLVDELDFVLVPAEAWNKLVSWYGLAPNQEPIGRSVIEQGMFVKHCRVEVYLMDLKLSENSDINTQVTKQFSRAATIEDVEKEMRKLFNIDESKEVRLWNRYMSNTYEHLSKKDNTLQDAGLYQGQVIVVEQKNEDGTWPRQAKKSGGYSSMSSSSSSSMSNSYSNYDSSYGSTSNSYYNSYDKGGSYKPGLCGLANLGNTCFMNSALQCMSNVPALTEYMLSNRWEEELNKENPLGMRGEIAVSFAELIREMWSGTRAYTMPRNFKIAVGRFAPQFSGYQQQDSQELMAFLLDGLHEDLNRIRKKPYIELKDASGRDDAVVAREAWENYKKRNDSIIVDIFHGLLKSTVQCPDCQKISVTFDPFCYLSLPMPIKKERQMEVFYQALSPSAKPVQFKLTVPKAGCVLDLCKALSAYVEIPPERMVVTDVYNHRFHKIFANDEGLSHILDRDDIFIYEVPASVTEGADYQYVPVYFRELKRRSHSNYTTSNQLFGQPMLVAVPHNCTYEKLYSLLLERMSRFVRLPLPGDLWWKEENKEEEEENIVEDSVQEDQWQSQPSHSADDDNGNSSGDVKMETDRAGGDNENKDGEASTSTSSRKQCSGVRMNWETDDRESESKAEQESPPIFTLTAVNSYGSADSGVRLENNGKPLKLTNRSYIAVDWTPLSKEKFYDEKLAEDMEQHDSMRFRTSQKRPVLQLDDCLRLFTEAEKLSEQDPWYCPQCRKHQQATKKFDLWSFPQYLIIHLKRFSYNRYWRDKIDALVEFPTQGLDLRKYIINPEARDVNNVYDLIAVTNHYGGLGGGHYTAFAQNKDDKEWYYFDDSSVSSSSEESVVTKAAYVLVYQRRGPDGVPRHVPNKSRPPPSATTTSITAASTTDGDTTVNGYNSDDEMDTN
ncbi:ubiquitin carboxyl-terminal hydrolase 15-like isoform X2 [Pomacea canaliculata]|uniref:ubiquitin carboxyl-terminal hydrolase 15-like isoform X2 n=1 Tax=Pomacea canaliculata TaxID=400727 RepID=UPI000D736AB4|nr:ubiquitin carboxyl-terminal hydrolase 15-like isoform X2 [Pomacea canaliculata]